MSGIVELTSLSMEAALPFGWTMVVRGAALLCLALGITVALRRAPAALRHHVWALAMSGLIALPALTQIVPAWRVALPGADAIREAWSASPVAATFEGRFDAARPETAPLDAGPESASAATGAPASRAASERRPATGGGDGERAAWPAPPSLAELIAAAWAVGSLLLLLRLAGGVVRAACLVRRAEPVTDRRWNVLVSALCLKSGLDTDVRVVSSPEVGVPMAWGIFGAWLVLPEGIETWPEERRRVVVLHELAHLRRRDCASQALARLALALHWPNPLAWLAVRRMRSEREQACDDAVLAAGVGGPAYAHHLVDIARGISSSFRPARAAVAMARASELENRVLAILDTRRPRRGLGRRTARLGFAGLALLLVPVATVRPTSAAGGTVSPEPAMSFDAEADGSEVRDGGTGAEFDAEADVSAEAVVETAPGSGKPAPGPNEPGRDRDDASGESSLRGLEESSQSVPDTIEERVFRALLRALDSDDPEVRQQVVHTFGTMESPRAVEPLSAVVRSDPDPDVREQAAWALGMIEADGAVDALADAASDDVDAVRQQVAWALGMIESARGVATLVPLLDDDSPRVREQAAWGLGMIESAEAVDALARAFGSEAEAEIRAQIVWALGMIEDRSALETVVDALEDPDAEVRDQALWALGMIMG